MDRETSAKLSRYVVTSDAIFDAEAGFLRRVVFSTRSTRRLVLSESVWSLLQQQRLSEIPAEFLEVLKFAQIVVGEQQDELSEVLGENRQAIASNSQLYHVIQPTAACQLGCGYCGQAHSGHLLNEAHAEQLLERLRHQMEHGRYSSLAIGWFGSEPLLGLSVIRKLSPRLISLASEFGASYSAKIVTNGVLLTPEVAKELYQTHQVREAEITLDGPADVHDRRRATKKGRSSFKSIFGNLIAIRDRSDVLIKLVVRCNVDEGNAEYVSDLIQLLADNDLQGRVSFYVSPVYSWGNDADKSALDPRRFARWEIEWLAQLLSLGFPVGLLPERRRITCLAVHKDGQLTDAFGSVFSCTEVSYVPAYGTPNKFRIVDLREARRKAPFRQFNDEMAAGDHASCRACAMLPVCGGSCPKLWSEGKTPCPSVKENVRERLALWFAAHKHLVK